MEIPDFIDPLDPDFEKQLAHIHSIKEHLDMLLFAAYAGVIDRFFRDHPDVQAISIDNVSDASDDGRYAFIKQIQDEEELEIEITDNLAEELNEMRDRGFYGGLDAMFKQGRIEREDVPGQFREYWAVAEGDDAGKRWDTMVAGAGRARLDAGTDIAKPAVAGAGPRI